MERTANCLLKFDRMNKALHHQEPDRVPISDFFGAAFWSAGGGNWGWPRTRIFTATTTLTGRL